MFTAVLLAVLSNRVFARQLRQDVPVFMPLSEYNGVGSGNGTLLSSSPVKAPIAVRCSGVGQPCKLCFNALVATWARTEESSISTFLAPLQTSKLRAIACVPVQATGLITTAT